VRNTQPSLCSRAAWTFLSFFLCTSLSELALHAQQNVGRLLGIVRDPSTAVVPGASISVRSVGTGVVTELRTNSEGAYAFPVLPIGEYVLTIRAPGFKTLEQPAIRIVSAESVTLDLKLELGEPSETIQVSAVTPMVDAVTTTSGTTRLGSELSELPLLNLGGDRTVMRYLFTLPGVAPLVSSSGRSSGYYANAAINGAPAGGESLSVDGVVGNSIPHQSMGDQLAPPPETIEEIRLNATGTAEYGWNAGVGVTVVTKSGTNTLHGDVFEYFRNEAMDARNTFAGTVSPQKQNEYGFTLGGPVVIPRIYNGKNKTFFFGLFSGYKYRAAPAGGLFTVPTAAMRQGDFRELLGRQIGTDSLGRPVLDGEIYDPTTTRSDGKDGFIRDPFSYNGQLNVIPPSILSSVSQFFTKQYPTPNLPGTQLNYAGSRAPSPKDLQKGAIKIDHHFNGNNTMNASFEVRSVVSIAGGLFGLSPISSSFRDNSDNQRVRLGYNTILGGNKVLGFRIGLNRLGNHSGSTPWEANVATQAGLKGTFDKSTPTISIAQVTGFGQPIAGDANTFATTVPVNVDFNWVVANHNFKFGAAQLRTRWAQVYCVGCTGRFNFNQRETGLPGISNTGHGYASFLLGQVDSASLTTGWPTLHTGSTYGFYGLDTWRVTPKLTLNYGLRLDYFGSLSELHDAIGVFDPTIPNPGAGGRLGAISFFGTGPGRNGRHSIGPGATFWAPNVGFAYALRPRIVFRAGYGLTSTALFSILGSGGNLPKPGWVYSASPTSFDLGVTPAFQWDQGAPFNPPPLPNLDPAIANNSGATVVHPYDFKPGRVQNLNAGIEQQLPRNVILRADYVANLSHGLHVNGLLRPNELDLKHLQLGNLLLQNINSPVAQAAGIPLPYPGFTSTVSRALTPYPQYTGISDPMSRSGYSLYHSLQVALQKRFGQGLYFLASYTASKQLTNALTFSSTGVGGGFTQSQNFARTKWLGVDDIPQYVSLSYLYQLPFGPGKRFASTTNPVLKQLVSGWQVSGWHTYSKGTPVYLSTLAGVPGGFGSIWANRVPNVPMVANSCTSSGPNLNVNAFTQPAPFTFGNTAVLPNVRTCSLFNENFSLQKEFKFNERSSMLFSGDFTNIFNRTQLTQLQTNIDIPGSFGRYTAAFDPRFVQLHFKLRF
jgi:hypothetical protein